VQTIALSLLEQLLVEWLLAQPCYLLFPLPAAAAVVMRWAPSPSLPGCTACAHSCGCASAFELQNFLGAVVAGEDRMEPGQQPQQRVN